MPSKRTYSTSTLTRPGRFGEQWHIAIGILAVCRIVQAQPSIVNLGTLPGGAHSLGHAVSADGSVVVGRSSSTAGDRAFRWTSSGGMQDLGVPLGGSHSTGLAVSADGSVVAGAYSGSGFNNRGFRWTTAGGMQSLGVLAGGQDSMALSVSGDGSAVAGWSNIPG